MDELADLLLAGHEDEDVAAARRVAVELEAAGDGGLGVVVDGRRRVEDVDGVGPPGHADDGRVVEEAGEGGDVERRGHEQDPQGPRRRAPRPGRAPHEAAEHVRVQRALVGLVDDDARVVGQLRVPEALADHETVRREFHGRRGRHLALEAHGVAHGLADGAAPLVGDALADREHRDAPRLRDADARAPRAAAEAGLDEEPRHLRRLAAARLADEEHRRVRLDRREDLVARGEHGQRRVHGDAPRRARHEVREDLLRLLLFGLR